MISRLVHNLSAIDEIASSSVVTDYRNLCHFAHDLMVRSDAIWR